MLTLHTLAYTAATTPPRNQLLLHSFNAQIWQLIGWSEDGGVRRLARASQPIQVHWVGDDGSVLASGRFLDEPVPMAIDRAQLKEAWRTLLITPKGEWRPLELADSFKFLGATESWLFLVTRTDGQDHLLRVSRSAQTQTKLLSARFLADLQFDGQRKRLIVTATLTGDNSFTEQLWGGAVDATPTAP